jgi:sugar/nucleoside kinase (ribokinase family)
MNTCLGAASAFTRADVDEAVVRAARVTYLEGYLFDKPTAQEAFRHVAAIVHNAGRKLSLTLSDTFCVLRHHDAFLHLVEQDVDILFANENEIKTLYKTENLDEAVAAVRPHTEVAVITRGAEPTLLVTQDVVHEIPVQKPARILDTTGAGDLYAAGFLYGLTQGKALPEAARIGAIAAAEIISHYGPRPHQKLSALL